MSDGMCCSNPGIHVPGLLEQAREYRAQIARLTAALAAMTSRAEEAESSVGELKEACTQWATDSRVVLAAYDKAHAEVERYRKALEIHRHAMAAVLHPMMDGSERERIKHLLARPALLAPGADAGAGE